MAPISLKKFNAFSEGPAEEFAWDVEVQCRFNSDCNHISVKLNRRVKMIMTSTEGIRHYSLVEIGEPLSVMDVYRSHDLAFHGLYISHGRSPLGQVSHDKVFEQEIDERDKYVVNHVDRHRVRVRLDLPENFRTDITESFNALMKKTAYLNYLWQNCAYAGLHFLNDCFGYGFREIGPITPGYFFNEVCKLALRQNSAREKKLCADLNDCTNEEEWLGAAHRLLLNHIHRLETEYMQAVIAARDISLSPTVFWSRTPVFFKNCYSSEEQKKRRDKIGLLHELKDAANQDAGSFVKKLDAVVDKSGAKHGRTYTMLAASLESCRKMPPHPLRPALYARDPARS